MSKTVKSVTKAVSSAVPKITMDPGKLVSNAVQGVTNLQKDILIKPAADLAGAAVGAVGQVMSQPGAGAVLGAAGTAFGIPGAGALAGAFSGQPTTMAPAPAPTVQSQAPIIIPQSSGGGDSGNSTNMMMMVGMGMGGLLLIMVLFLGMRGKR